MGDGTYASSEGFSLNEAFQDATGALRKHFVPLATVFALASIPSWIQQFAESDLASPDLHHQAYELRVLPSIASGISSVVVSSWNLFMGTATFGAAISHSTTRGRRSASYCGTQARDGLLNSEPCSSR